MKLLILFVTFMFGCVFGMWPLRYTYDYFSKKRRGYINIGNLSKIK